MNKQREDFEKYLLLTDKFKFRNKEFLFMIDENGVYEDAPVLELWQAWQKAQKVAVPDGFVLVEKSKISYFYQDSDEPENCCSHERDFDCLGDCIDNGDIMEIDRYAEIHLSKDTVYGAWCKCEPKPFSQKTKEFRLFPSREEAEKAMIESQEQDHEKNGYTE